MTPKENRGYIRAGDTVAVRLLLEAHERLRLASLHTNRTMTDILSAIVLATLPPSAHDQETYVFVDDVMQSIEYLNPDGGLT